MFYKISIYFELAYKFSDNPGLYGNCWDTFPLQTRFKCQCQKGEETKELGFDYYITLLLPVGCTPWIKSTRKAWQVKTYN